MTNGKIIVDKETASEDDPENLKACLENGKSLFFLFYYSYFLIT